MRRKRKHVGLVLAGLAVAILVAILVIRGARQELSPSFTGNAGRRNDSGEAGTPSSERPSPRESRGRERTAPLSQGDLARSARIKAEGQKFMAEIESRRASVFSRHEDADGNSSSTMVLERPTGQELAGIFGEYLESMPADERAFVDDSGLSSELKRDLADFFGYDSRYRYVTFLLKGDGSMSLPSVLIVESETLYDSEQTKDGVPAEELRLKEFMDLKEGEPSLERYHRLFSLK